MKSYILMIIEYNTIYNNEWSLCRELTYKQIPQKKLTQCSSSSDVYQIVISYKH